ncbi:MAG: hypothetical protein ACOYLX_05590 [Burkholderiaceae bacterium]
MVRFPVRSTLALLLSAAASVASAESIAASASSAGSSASSAGSASLRGSSDAISGSSESSKTKQAVIDGEYRVAGVDATPGKAGTRRLTLVPVEAAPGATGFRLDVPEQALGARPVGDRIRAQNRPYGVEFARVDVREPFFLVLDDASHRDLQTRVVTR